VVNGGGAVKPEESVHWAGGHEEMELITIVEIQATDPLMSAVYALRHDVFVVEQGVPEELEVDEDDKVAVHLAALSDGHVVGTLRILRHGRTAKIGRMAVSASSRKEGIGRALMEFAAAAASRRGADEVVLGAQLTACEFYKRLGYVEEGAVFDDAGIPHVMMRKKLQR
jgi:predicted GNAT family N-acyltransferase